MARKKPHEEHENHERWLVSYADFITLLFAFFVVMYAISSVNEGKYRVLSDALVAAFRSSPKSLEPIQIGNLSKAPVISTAQEDHRKPAMVRLPKMYVSRSDSLEGQVHDPLMEEKYIDGDDLVNIGKIADEVQEALEELVKQGVITINRSLLWIEVEIKDSILFPSGSARLQEEAIPVLEELASILQEFPNPIRVEGHTDNVPINTVVYPSNWELSAARATSVIRLFAAAGIDPLRMVAQGYGEYRPVADNDTPEGRARNRRVVIVVLADKTVERLLGDRVVAARRRFIMPPVVDQPVEETSGVQAVGEGKTKEHGPAPAAGEPQTGPESPIREVADEGVVSADIAGDDPGSDHQVEEQAQPAPAETDPEQRPRHTGGPPPRLVRWRDSDADTRRPAPVPPSTPLLAPRVAPGLSLYPPINLGAPTVPLMLPPAPEDKTEAMESPLPSSVSSTVGETLSEITNLPLGRE